MGCGNCLVLNSILQNQNHQDKQSYVETVGAIGGGRDGEGAVRLGLSDSSIHSNGSIMSSTTMTHDDDTNTPTPKHTDTHTHSPTLSQAPSQTQTQTQTQADLSMIVPSLRHMAGLEYNIEPLKMARKGILPFLPPAGSRCKLELESLTLWHGSILSEGVERSMVEGDREGEGGSEGEGGNGLCALSDGGSGSYSDVSQQHQVGKNSNTMIKNNTTTHTHKNRMKYDVISCIEVIEHLPSESDAAIALETILCHFQPNYAIFSTPNYESNRAIQMAADGLPYKKSTKLSELKKKNEDKNIKFDENVVPNLEQECSDLECVGDESASPPTPVPATTPIAVPAPALVPESFREADHKFEFTRAEFRDWAYAGLRASGGQYEVQFTEVGSRLPGMGGVEEEVGREGGGLLGVRSGDRDVDRGGNRDVDRGGDRVEGVHKGDGPGVPDVCCVEGTSSDAVCGVPNSDTGRYVDTDGSLKRSRERGCGGASQVAIFRRIKRNSSERTSTYTASDDVPVTQEQRGEEMPAATLFWNWSRDT